MAIASVPDLFQALRASALLTEGQMDVLAQDLLPRLTDPRELARELVRRDWLTPFQVNQLFLGRGEELFLGSYVLLDRLGEGAMGQVFKARHRKMNRVAALKVIRREKLGTSETVRRFFREVQAAAALDHPNIVQAYDADEVNGTYFFAMEYVEGNDLGKLVKQKGRLKIGKACEYVRQVALGLQHAFEKGLVHRDIKPSNIIVRTSGSRSEGVPLVKILDMGLARLHGPLGEEPDGPLTQVHAILGTPDFIAPEQARSAREVDIRADLYSLGCTFYYALTAQVPFPAEAPMEKLLKHYLEERPRVEALRPEVPRGITAVIRKLMAKDPAQRYQTPAELAAVLATMVALPGRTGAAVPLALPVGPPLPEAPSRPAPPDGSSAEETVPEVVLEFETADSIVQIDRTRGQRGRRARRRRLLLYAIAGLALGLMTALVLVLLRFALH
jgi:serine/threonine-protein kinase